MVYLGSSSSPTLHRVDSMPNRPPDPYQAYFVCLGERFLSTFLEFTEMGMFWANRPAPRPLEIVSTVRSYPPLTPAELNGGPTALPVSTSVGSRAIVTSGVNGDSVNTPVVKPHHKRRFYLNRTLSSPDFWYSVDESWFGNDKEEVRTGLLAIQTYSERFKLALELPFPAMMAALQATLDSFSYNQVRDWERHLQLAIMCLEDQPQEVFDGDYNSHALFIIACGKEYYNAFRSDPVTYHVKLTYKPLANLPSHTIGKNFGARFVNHTST